jgi:hypothetical protein
MSVLFKTSVAAALSLILGVSVGALNAASVVVSGGSSADVGGWQISRSAGVNLNIAGVDSQTLVIQSETATFENDNPLSVSFQQLSADAAAFVNFEKATFANNTGSDWTNFTFSLTGAASFASVADVFIPPLEPGVNFSSVTLTPPATLVYGGQQQAGATATWGGTTSTDDLLISSAPAANLPLTAFTLNESTTVSEVRAPLAAWQSLSGLLLVIVITAARPPHPAPMTA